MMQMNEMHAWPDCGRGGNWSEAICLAIVGPRWALVGPPWALVGNPWALVGFPWALVGPLGALWAPLGPCGPLQWKLYTACGFS